MKRLSESEAKAQTVSLFSDCGLAPDDAPDAIEANGSMRAELETWRATLIADYGLTKAMKIIAYVMGCMSSAALIAAARSEDADDAGGGE